MTEFNEFGLAGPILAALEKEGHKTPTPIQARAIPELLSGSDVLGLAQTGSGKTAAFALPILHRLFETPERIQRSGSKPRFGPRALVLSPTRELAGQIRDRFKVYGARTSLSMALAIGGVSLNKQAATLSRGVDIFVATPGRLEDLQKQGAVDLDQVEILVLDEVDQMLDMGFIHVIRRICRSLPAERQSVFFSATMPKEIARLAHALLTDPVRIEIEKTARPKISQSVQFMGKGQKPAALIRVASDPAFTSGLVFSRTKHGADKIARILNKEGINAQAIHGNRSQNQRERALNAFKSGKAQVLVATDIAARGIDIAGVSHVVNFDLPNVPETYVHRIGRTGRAGASGIAVSFCSPDERADLRAIEKLMGERLEAVHLNGQDADLSETSASEGRGQQNRQQHRKQGGQRHPGNGQRQPRRENQGPKRRSRPNGEQRDANRPDGEANRTGEANRMGEVRTTSKRAARPGAGNPNHRRPNDNGPKHSTPDHKNAGPKRTGHKSTSGPTAHPGKRSDDAPAENGKKRWTKRVKPAAGKPANTDDNGQHKTRRPAAKGKRPVQGAASGKPNQNDRPKGKPNSGGKAPGDRGPSSQGQSSRGPSSRGPGGRGSRGRRAA